MDAERLNVAIKEAERFLSAAKVAKKRLIMDRFSPCAGSKETGAARRASMDLSRALSDLRRPG